MNVLFTAYLKPGPVEVRAPKAQIFVVQRADPLQ
jgi:hypothetical protein